MNPPRRNLTPSQAAAHLGVSTKALRLYEQQGLLAPDRSSAGWRLYRPEDVERAATIVSLRVLGLSLAEIARVMDGDPSALEAGLVAHEERLWQQAQHIETALQRIRSLRDNIGQGKALDAAALSIVFGRDATIATAFELPWPWDGEWFETCDVGPLNFITGPLGSGKTRFAERLAGELPNAEFLGLDRLSNAGIGRLLEEDAALTARVEHMLGRLEEEGAERTQALLALVVALETERPAILVVDMVEEGLCDTAQRALIARLRVKPGNKRALFLMTRSSSILDLDRVRADEAVFYCPANHSPPFRAHLYPGGRGYEAVATCVATPVVRARTTGIIAIPPGAVG
ncbi:MerR family transcriptional regulator [Sphingomonas sp. JC676]|uniref:MerR family transcriptional regulator n=1 Tax=Sphingomonas sp. JC676 TaxID=2768065 RepID=UPI0016583EF8|nr:MerR family transcriptional regulator [Sphingomonas sp. JC676]MBC9033272.1 MerR family transcriptional regulator [Sphingomonas sp. JC676]